jgi:hypothetical protein
MKTNWTRDELASVVTAYFDMLEDELAGKKYNKAAVNRSLRSGVLVGRNRGSVEFRMQNISSVLSEIGHPFIQGYKPRKNVGQNVTDQLLEIIKEQGLIDSSYKKKSTTDSSNPEAIKEVLNDLLGGDEDSDTIRKVLARVEQPKLRKALIGKTKQNPCAVCLQQFSNDFLVAAHIKRRSECCEEERRNKNIAMLLCRFGCDELFERGYIVVDDSGVVGTNKQPTNNAEIDYMAKIVGKQCSAWNRTTTEPFFQWHRSFHA